VLTVGGTLVPLVYFAALGKLDLSWELARDASRHSFPLLAVVVALAPLGVFGLIDCRGKPRDFLSSATRIFPLAALGVYFLSSSVVGATPLHAFDGTEVPMAVLAVNGWERLGWARRLRRPRVVAVALLLLATIPATIKELSVAEFNAKPTAGNPNFITRDEGLALKYLRSDPEPGSVLTSYYLGGLIPSKTQRRTYVGDCIWSEPNCTERARGAQRLIDDKLTPSQAWSVAKASSARFVLANCSSPSDLSNELTGMIASVHRFGCATVYELVDPLPSSAADAASVRAQGRQ
jgi:hypothetical protein